MRVVVPRLLAHVFFIAFVVTMLAFDCCSKALSSTSLGWSLVPLTACYLAILIDWLRTISLIFPMPTHGNLGTEINSILFRRYPYLNVLAFAFLSRSPTSTSVGSHPVDTEPRTFLRVYNRYFDLPMIGMAAVVAILVPYGLFHSKLIAAFTFLFGEYFGYRVLAYLVLTISFNAGLAILFRLSTALSERRGD